jgi:hypothetical protein
LQFENAIRLVKNPVKLEGFCETVLVVSELLSNMKVTSTLHYMEKIVPLQVAPGVMEEDYSILGRSPSTKPEVINPPNSTTQAKFMAVVFVKY